MKHLAPDIRRDIDEQQRLYRIKGYRRPRDVNFTWEFYFSNGSFKWIFLMSALCPKARALAVDYVRHKLGCAWDDLTILTAVNAKSMELMKCTGGHYNGHIDIIATEAAGIGSLVALIYAYLRHCKRDGIRQSSRRGHYECLAFSEMNLKHLVHSSFKVLGGVVFGGHFVCMVYLIRCGFDFSGTVELDAIKTGSMECLVYLGRFRHFRGMSSLSQAAAQQGNIRILRYLHKNKYTMAETLCSDAVKGRSLECLQFAHEIGAQLTNDVCKIAAKCGLVEILRYAHQHGAYWDENVCLWAHFTRNFACLRYAVENGCPCDAAVMELMAAQHAE